MLFFMNRIENKKLTEQLKDSFTLLSDLKWLLDFPHVETLVLDHNHITSHVKMPELPQLHTLWVNQNKISNLSKSFYFFKLQNPSLFHYNFMK